MLWELLAPLDIVGPARLSRRVGIVDFCWNCTGNVRTGAGGEYRDRLRSTARRSGKVFALDKLWDGCNRNGMHEITAIRHSSGSDRDHCVLEFTDLIRC